MAEPLVRRLRVAAVVLGAVTVGIHLLHTSYGGAVLPVYLLAGRLADPRPLAFLLGAFAIVFCGMLAYVDLARGPAYLATAAVACTFVVGFGVWHTVLDHGAFWPHLSSRGHDTRGPLLVVLDHLLADRLALVSKVAEVGLAVVSMALYRMDGE